MCAYFCFEILSHRLSMITFRPHPLRFTEEARMNTRPFTLAFMRAFGTDKCGFTRTQDAVSAVSFHIGIQIQLKYGTFTALPGFTAVH